MTEIYSRPFTSSLPGHILSHEQRTLSAPHISGTFQRSDKCLLKPEPSYRGSCADFLQSMPGKEERASYESTSAKVGDMYGAKQETPNPPREQLPPLSSLFGSASHQSRPGQSPFSEHQSPVFPTSSPLDTRHPGTPSNSDRSHDASHFKRPSASRHYSYGAKPEHIERLGIQPPSRPSNFAAQPESPRSDGRHGLPDMIRPHLSTTLWTATRPDSFSRDTSSSFRAQSESRPHTTSTHRQEQDSRSYREIQMPVTTTYTSFSAPTGTEEKNTKDTLGPKIWTGTQFLPRFVRQADVPGEGICYFYDDGTHCKTVIDGEIVNAHWGVTKAGKPRKRLAIACITCREKKIKCDPDFPRCVQCEKFGRVCKFKNAPRGSQGSPDTPPADADDIFTRPGSSRTEAESFKLDKRETSCSTSPTVAMRHASPDVESAISHSKRQRTGYNDFTPVASDASPRPSVHEATGPRIPWMEPLISSTIDHNVLREWQVNPYTTAPALITDLMGIFFAHVPATASFMFPEGPFKSWVLSGGEKSLDELMLIYSVLALATVVSPKPEHKALGIQYAAISRNACDSRHFSIQLVQSRLILCLYYFGINNANDCWDYCGSAIRAASGVRLNLEIEKSPDGSLKDGQFPYGLNRAGYAECRRRTLWSCYLMDRYYGFSSGHLSFMNKEDVFLRLPCDYKSFESQLETQNPYFSPSTPIIQSSTWTVGSMAYLINIATIWGDVAANIYRTSQRCSPVAPNPPFNSFYDNTTQRLHDWKSSLPLPLQFSTSNVDYAADTGSMGTFMTMHSIYHNTAMKLNRYIKKSTLSPAQLDHHHRVARQHAEEVLVMMDVLASRRASNPINPSRNFGGSSKFSNPLLGFAIVSAVDILSASFRRESIPNRLASFGGARVEITKLATFWQSSKHHLALVSQRSSEMRDIMNSGDTTEKCEMRDPIEDIFERAYDSFYT